MQTHAVAFSQALEAQGYAVRVLTYRAAASEAEACRASDAQFRFPVARILSRLAYWANVKKIAAYAKEHGAQAIYSSTVYFAQAAALAQVPMFCRSAGNDVLRPWIAWPFRWAAPFLDQPLFEAKLYPWLRRRELPEYFDRYLERTRQRVMRESACAMGHLAANSEFTAQALKKIGVAPERIAIEPGGVDPALFCPGPSCRTAWGIPPQSFLLLTACRLVAKKGLPLLLEAVAQLAPKLPALHLAVAGDGPDRARLAAMAEALGLKERVHFLGRLPGKELAQAYRAADVFVLPSRSIARGGQQVDAETMGRVLCEAGACGLPVVAAATGGIPSVVRDGDNGLLFEENQIAELVAAILRLARDPDLRLRLGQAGRKRAQEEFAWEHLTAAATMRLEQMLSLENSSIIAEQPEPTGNAGVLAAPTS
ncbi:MAG: glycosyltransferase family 4 protein [Bryobacter sp.]|nr:glycosyltransferase family 4 protein [Bryobacter sp.]